jgi:deoxyuridine 5'-triphosphate nucleotidohydrolase
LTFADGRVAPRSGLAAKHGIDTMAGVIDADYRGQVGVILANLSDEDFEIKEGDRIAQLIIEQVSFFCWSGWPWWPRRPEWLTTVLIAC